MGTEFIHPIGSVTSRSVPKGDWNVMRSRDVSTSPRSSYPTYKSSMLPHVRPAKCSPIWSVKGVTPACFIVTWFSGSRLCTMRNNLPSFLTTQNHLDRYDEFDGSYTPATSFR